MIILIFKCELNKYCHVDSIDLLVMEIFCWFLFKVSIPGLATQYQPPKLCRTVDEAKSYAAEYTLQQLGVPIEGMSR